MFLTVLFLCSELSKRSELSKLSTGTAVLNSTAYQHLPHTDAPPQIVATGSPALNEWRKFLFGKEGSIPLFIFKSMVSCSTLLQAGGMIQS